jgi:hypothetical protein
LREGAVGGRRLNPRSTIHVEPRYRHLAQERKLMKKSTRGCDWLLTALLPLALGSGCGDDDGGGGGSTDTGTETDSTTSDGDGGTDSTGGGGSDTSDTGSETGTGGTGTTDTECDPIIHTEDIEVDETWEAGCPHIVDGCISVGGDATVVASLTIEAGVEVRFTGESCLIIGESGSRGALIAEGTETDKIVFTSDQPDGDETPGYWDAVIFGEETAESTTLDHVVFEFGGRIGSGAHSGPNWGDSMVLVWGNDSTLPAVSFRNMEVRQSATDGIMMASGARFSDDSEAVVVAENAGYPVHIEAASAHTLPTDAGSDYTGNGDDGIHLLYGNGHVLSSGTLAWEDPGVPYVNQDFYVDGADLTIATGVTIASEASSEILVTNGSVSADGVTFTTWPDNVYWTGLYFDVPGTGALENCVVERGGSDAGGNSEGYNIYVESGAGDLPTITGCEIRDSLHDGISTWDVPLVEYQGNTFTNNADWDIYDYFNDEGWNQ